MHWLKMKKSIENNTFYGACMMHGAEEYLKDTVIKTAIATNVPAGLEDVNISKIASDDISKIQESVNMPPFMADKRIVIIDSYKKFYAPKSQYKSDDMMAAIDAIGEIVEKEYKDCCIFFLCRGKVEATNPLYKIFKSKDRNISYSKVTEKEKVDILAEVAKDNKIEISNATIGFLIRYTNGDLLQLVGELNKLQSYKKGKIETRDIQSICHASTDYNVFAMIKAIEQKREDEALKILRDMLRGGEYVGGIVSLIERQYRVFAFIEDIQREYKSNIDFVELETRLGVKSFVIEKMYRQGLRMDKEKRDAILAMCTDADYLAKRGRINNVAALESLVIKLMTN